MRSRGTPAGLDPQWRRTAEARIEELHDAMLAIIATLDTADGDTELEPSICGSFGPCHVPITDDREGGDVLDEGEPHDWDDEVNGDEEPTLGWSHAGQGGVPLGWSYHPFSAAVDHDD